MLVALLTFLFLGGGIEDPVLNYVKLTRGSVDDIVVDDDRRAEAKVILERMTERTKLRTKTAKELFESLRSELSHRDANIDSINVILGDYDAAIRSHNADMIDLRFELKEQLTREEWTMLFGGADSG